MYNHNRNTDRQDSGYSLKIAEKINLAPKQYIQLIVTLPPDPLSLFNCRQVISFSSMLQKNRTVYNSVQVKRTFLNRLELGYHSRAIIVR